MRIGHKRTNGRSAGLLPPGEGHVDFGVAVVAGGAGVGQVVEEELGAGAVMAANPGGGDVVVRF